MFVDKEIKGEEQKDNVAVMLLYVKCNIRWLWTIICDDHHLSVFCFFYHTGRTLFVHF